MSALTFEQLKEELLQNPETREAYNELQPEFAIKRAIIEARINRGITQTDLAKAMGTSQSVISRWETGPFDPRLSNLRKLAAVLQVTFRISCQGLTVDVDPDEMPDVATTFHPFDLEAEASRIAQARWQLIDYGRTEVVSDYRVEMARTKAPVQVVEAEDQITELAPYELSEIAWLPI